MRDKSIVAVVLFDRAPLFEMSVPISVFGVDRSDVGGPHFSMKAVRAEPGVIRTTGGVEIAAPFGLEALDTAGIVIIPSWRDPLEIPPEPVLAAIRDAHADGALVVSLCMGAFVLAATGLLDDRRAVTHWYFSSVLASRYPRVKVEVDALYIDDGDLITSAGTAAALDACLHLVRRVWGSRAAAAIARRMVVAPHRSGGQAQFVDAPGRGVTLGRVGVSTAMEYALHHLSDADLDVDQLAVQALLSRRTFDRHFRDDTGLSPMQWLVQQRVLRAQGLLEETDWPVDAIARAVGLASAVSLRPHFRRLLGVSPRQYREAFRDRDDDGGL